MRRRSAVATVYGQSTSQQSKRTAQQRQSYRSALEPFVRNPERFVATGEVVKYSEDFAFVRDKYPKALVHYLVIPRAARYTNIHPLDAFKDDTFFIKTSEAVEECKKLVICELSEKLGIEACNADRYVQAGVHACPSLSNLHVHVITTDNFSPSLKTKRHYNSFNTPFFVKFCDSAELRDRQSPASDNFRLQTESLLKQDLICWSCKSNYGNRFKEFKGHLASEYNSLKRI
ncbi:aprataxin-like protein [Dipodascopsis tothii]|uniref:aprataxin-like protein n=1 Tax=Dipodascopsis tothii TaxID=44089 RepID=UPI0034CEC42F